MGPGSALVDGPEPNVEVRSAGDLDYEEYAAFQRRAFGDLLQRRGASDAHMTPDFYRWKYRPPHGEGRVVRVVRDGEILSSSAAFPLRVTHRGQSATAWHCVDVATVPEARRRGHFLTTLRRLGDTLASGEILYAFPNEGSIRSFLEVGCAEKAVVTTWIVPSVRLIRKRVARVRAVERFGPEHAVAATADDVDGVAVDRTPDYLNWRYLNHPSTDYVAFDYCDPDCRGICVVRTATVMGRDVALVMELSGSTTRVQAALLSHAADWAHGSGVGVMALMTTALSLGLAVRRSMVPVPSRLLPKRQVLVLRGTGDRVAPMTTAKWLVQTGDWDVF